MAQKQIAMSINIDENGELVSITYPGKAPVTKPSQRMEQCNAGYPARAQ